MEKTRRARLEATLLRELAVMISRQLKDPRIPPVTVTSVRTAPDCRNAAVTVALLRAGAAVEPGTLKEYSREETREALRALNHAAPFLHREISRSLRIKIVPRFTFKLDRGVENTLAVHELLKKVHEEEPHAGDRNSDDNDDDDE